MHSSTRVSQVDAAPQSRQHWSRTGLRLLLPASCNNGIAPWQRMREHRLMAKRPPAPRNLPCVCSHLEKERRSHCASPSPAKFQVLEFQFLDVRRPRDDTCPPKDHRPKSSQRVQPCVHRAPSCGAPPPLPPLPRAAPSPPPVAPSRATSAAPSPLRIKRPSVWASSDARDETTSTACAAAHTTCHPRARTHAHTHTRTHTHTPAAMSSGRRGSNAGLA